MEKNEQLVYSMGIRSRLNELFVLCKLIDTAMDNDNPDVRALSLKAAEAIHNSSEELAGKLFDFMCKLDGGK